VSFGEIWFLATAGHVIQDLDALVSQRYVKVVDSFLVDSLGSQASHHDNIPFNYEETPRHARYEDGLDFGFIAIDGNTKKLLQANGIEPVPIHDWIKVDVEKCFRFALLGIPAELVCPQERDSRHWIWIGTLLTSLRRMKRLPRGVKPTKHKRFIGKIMKQSELQSLKGVSGGPIIGFFQVEDQTRYWVVAIQSSCVGKKYVFGCPVTTCGRIVLDEVKALIDELEVADGAEEKSGAIAVSSGSAIDSAFR